MARIEEMGLDEFCDYLLEKGFHSDVVTSFNRNRVSGATFLALSDDDLKDLVPVIGDRVNVRKLLVEAREATSDCVTNNVEQGCDRTQCYRSPMATKDCNVAPDTPSSQPSDWHQSFQIPERESFSGSVQRAIDTGVISSKARREIVQVLRTLISMHTLYPVSEQYIAVSQKLVAKYPNLRDPIGTNGFGSWRMSLRSSFKNFRRDHPTDENGQSVVRRTASASKELEPPSKRMRTSTDDDGEEMSDEDYEEAVKELQSEYRKGRKGGRNQATLKQLMEKTRTKRRRWMENDRPLVSEVIKMFPCLETSRMLRREFKSVAALTTTAGSLMDSWPEWRKKLIQFAKLESATRPVLKKVLGDLESEDSVACPDDHCDATCLDLLTRLLYPRGLGKKAVLIKHFETCDIDLDGEVSKIEQSAPFVVWTGTVGDENAQFYICCEQSILLESKTVRDAIIDLVATYYVFDIAYPKSISAIMLFFQHMVFEIKDKQVLPVTTSKLVSNLSKLS